MKKNLLITFLVLIAFLAFSQPAIKWQKSFGGPGIDKCNSIIQTSDSGYVIAGETSSTSGDITVNNGTNDFWVAKIDTAGVMLWQKSLGGSGDDRANGVTQTNDGGYVVVGTSNSPIGGDITSVKGQYDVWVTKLTATGSLSWQKNYGGTAVDEAFAVQATSDGGCIVVGDSRSNNYDLLVNNGLSDFWIFKLDALGAMQWQKALGGSGVDVAYAVQQTSDGGYIVSGQTASNNADVSGNNGATDYWIVKLSSAGVVQWQKCYGGSGTDISTCIKQTSDGGYIVGGTTGSSNSGNVGASNGPENAWIVKLTSASPPAITWQKCFGGNGFDNCNSVQQTSDGGYIFTGAASSNTLDVSGNHGSYDYWVVKLTSAGTFTWQKCLGGTSSDTPTGIQVTFDNGYVVGGRSASNGGDVTNAKGLDDFWIVRFKGVATPTVVVPNVIGENESENSQFTIFPNPGYGLVTIENKNQNNTVCHIKLTDPLGRVIYENKIVAEKCDIDISTRAKGIYFLSIFSVDGSMIEVKKLVID